MRIKSIFIAVLLALWSSSVNATVYVGPMPSVVDVGSTYVLNWTATINYTYNLWLVVDDPASTAYDWTKVQTLASGLYYKTLDGSFPWTVPSNLSADSAYGVWFGCFPMNGSSLYTNITNYFTISNESLASATSTGTSSRTSAPSSTSSAAGTSSGASDDAASGSHHQNLSGGAIAGIVVGILVLIALATAAVLLYIWRKKKTDFEKREAAARASRLDPVMQAGHSSFEMQGRGPTKETNV